MSYCGNCGEKLIDNAQFCGNCGAKQNVNLNPNYVERPANAFEYNAGNGSGYNRPADNSHWGAPTNYPPQNMVNNQISFQKPKKKNTGWVIGLSAALIVLITVAIAVVKAPRNDEMTSNSFSVNDFNEASGLDETNEPIKDNVISDKTEEDESNKEYEKGTFTQNTYVSDFIGIRYNVPSGWALATESELLEISSDENSPCEMHAINSYDGSNIIIMAEKLPTKNFSETLYINSLKNSLNQSVGVAVEDIKEDGTYTIAGKEYKVISYTANKNGTQYVQVIYIRKINTHMIAIAVTSSERNNDEILSHFEEY